MDQNALKEILLKHKRWLEQKDGGERAYLIEAHLERANLEGADLRGADLRGAHLEEADLREAHLKNIIADPIICPSEGSFIGWKKAIIKYKDQNYVEIVIIKLLIPEDAKRSSAFGRKCRCNKAKVLGFFTEDGTEVKTDERTQAVSMLDHKFIYRLDETVSVDDFDENRFHECAPGIHFFMTFNEAVNW